MLFAELLFDRFIIVVTETKLRLPRQNIDKKYRKNVIKKVNGGHWILQHNEKMQ